MSSLLAIALLLHRRILDDMLESNDDQWSSSGESKQADRGHMYTYRGPKRSYSHLQLDFKASPHPKQCSSGELASK